MSAALVPVTLTLRSVAGLGAMYCFFYAIAHMPLADAMHRVGSTVRECLTCGNIATADTCDICQSDKRAIGQICVVEDVADLWAMERSGVFKGRYHVLGGLLSPLDGVRPDDLRLAAWLIEAGGSLEWVRRFVMKGLVPEQLELLNRLVDNTEHLVLRGTPVSLAMVEVDRYHEEAAYVVHRWVETFDIAGMGFGSTEYVHTFVEAKKLAFEDRARFYADMDFADVDVDWLIDRKSVV